MSVVQWEVDDLALYVPPERGGGGMRRVRICSAAFLEERGGRPMREVALLDERGRRTDVLEAHLAQCDEDFRLIGAPPEHLQIHGSRWDLYAEGAGLDAASLPLPDPSLRAEPSEHHLLALEQAEEAREAARAARRRRDTQTAREQSAKAAGLEMKVELDLADRAAQADAVRHQAEVEALAEIRTRVADEDFWRRYSAAEKALAEGRDVNCGSVSDDTPPVIVGAEVEDAYLAFSSKDGYHVRKRRVRRLRVLTPDGLETLHDSGTLSRDQVRCGLKYRAIFQATERTARSSLNFDVQGGLNLKAEDRKAELWAKRGEIERRAVQAPGINGFELAALHEVCGKGRAVSDVVSGGSKRCKLTVALIRVLEVIAEWAEEQKKAA